MKNASASHDLSRNWMKGVGRGVMVLAAFGAVSCSQLERDRNEIPKVGQQTEQTLNSVNQQGNAHSFDPLVVTDKVWTGDVALRIQRGIPLPPKYETEHGIAIVSADPMSATEIAAAVTAQTGIIMRATDLAGSSSTASTNMPNAMGGMAGGGSFTAPGMAANTGFGAPVVSPSRNSGGGMPVAYEGPLSGLLDRVASHFAASWRYDGKVIRLSRFETRVFTIEALPGGHKISTDMQGGTTSGSGGGGGGGGGGGSSGGGAGAGGSASSTATMDVKSDIDLKYWDEIKDVLTSMLGGVGSVVLSPALGTVTVSTTPEIMQTIASYVGQENARMSRQIAVNIEVYNVSISKNEDFDVTFSSFIRKLGTFGPLSLSSAALPTRVTSTDTMASANVAILNQGAGHTSVTDVFQALSAVGNTTRVAQYPFMTLNNRPVSVRVGRDITYVASTQANTAASGTGTTTTVTATAGQINEGVSIQIGPRLLDDGRILLEYALSSSELQSLDTFNSGCGVIGSTSADGTTCTGGTTGSSTLQLPTTITRNFAQQAVLRSGSTLIIGGVNQKQIQQNSQGVGDPFNFMLGGGSSDADVDTMMLVVITPQVIEQPVAEQD